MTPDESKRVENNQARDQMLEHAMTEIWRHLKNVRFGSIEITIHDSRVVQIELKEKVRFEAPQRTIES